MTEPGLDVRALQGLRAPRSNLTMIRQRLRHHFDQHEGYVAFSGGKDSLVALHLARQVDPAVPVAFFDSGFEFPETYAYLAQIRDLWRLDLRVIAAETPGLQVLAATGGWDHAVADPAEPPNLYRTLIAEPAAQAHRSCGPGEVWGVRSAESRGRAAAYANALRRVSCDCAPECAGPDRRERHGGLIERRDGTVAFGPVWDWKDHEIWGYITRHRLPINPVYDKLRRLGAPEHFLRVSTLLDATRLTEGRVAWLKRGWPTLVDEIATVLPRVREYI